MWLLAPFGALVVMDYYMDTLTIDNFLGLVYATMVLAGMGMNIGGRIHRHLVEGFSFWSGLYTLVIFSVLAYLLYLIVSGEVNFLPGVHIESYTPIIVVWVVQLIAYISQETLNIKLQRVN